MAHKTGGSLSEREDNGSGLREPLLHGLRKALLKTMSRSLLVNCSETGAVLSRLMEVRYAAPLRRRRRFS